MYRVLIHLVLLIFAVLLGVSCNKSVFHYSDAQGESTFVLYKKNYKYSEKTNNRSFKTHGTYEVTDSTLSFLQWGRENVPYTYYMKSVEVSGNDISSDSITITVIDNPTNEPILFATIAFMDAHGVVLGGIETNVNGKAIIAKNTIYDYLSIDYIGYGRVNVDNIGFRDKDFKIGLEEMKPGGRMSSGCLTNFLDVILTYKVDKNKNFTSFSKNGIIYNSIIEN